MCGYQSSKTMLSEAYEMLSDRAVQVYFLVLGLAVRRCIRKYYSRRGQTRAAGITPLLLSAAIIGITWYLILRFILTNLHTSESYFDDAYKDVLRTPGHYLVSTQLLTWAIVAVVWTADAGCDLAFLLFGFLGAMSASFVLWVPTLYHDREVAIRSTGSKRKATEQRRRTVPASYVLSSIVAFISILKLYPCTEADEDSACTPDQGFGSFHIHFRQWLQVLHVVLVIPVFLSFLLPKTDRMRMDSSLLFGFLSIAISIWHIYQIGVKRTAPSIPTTDCQISITTDLICCTIITLYAIHKDSTVQRTCIAALAIPIVSPAAVLAGHLCVCRLPDTYAAFISYVQRQVAARLQTNNTNDKRRWCNLGLWTKSTDGELCSYNQACENLAEALGRAAGLCDEDGVLSCGCGTMDEVKYYKDRFDLRHITGIDPCLAEARTTDEKDFHVRTIRAGVENCDGMFPPRFFDKILALDNVYHYPDKEMALRNLVGLVAPGGKVAVSDVLLKQSRGTSDTPLWARLALRLMGIPFTNLWTSDEYRSKLAGMGFDGVDVQTISEQVLIKGWSRYLPNALLRHLDYAIIVASAPIESKPRPKKKIAIIGSGLAGLSSAYYLLSSQHAADFSIDIFEANDSPGLAGNTTLIGEQLVDVPARMAALGYYNKYRELLEELNIPTTIVKTDCSFYGSDGNGGHVCHCYDKSSFVNVYSALCVGGFRRLYGLLMALSKLCDDHASVEHCGDVSQTFGQWLKANLGLSSETTYTCKLTGTEKDHDLPSLTCYDNPFAYVMVGSLSWMLSCTWDQLSKYPADIVLPYCKGLRMDRLGVGRKGQVIRISPSIKVLERALLYGVNNLQCGSRITGLDNKKIIDGVAYDAIICAAEARAVPKIIKTASKVFCQIAYHPSTIYLHKDESFMPPNKSEWKTWNVEMSSGREEPQLTFWLNEYYPDAKFGGNIFQTWSPSHVPKAELTIQRCDFQRVVHSNNSKEIVSEIERIQGTDGIYFAGSYTEYGMGLLEQALRSGRKASDQLLRNQQA